MNSDPQLLQTKTWAASLDDLPMASRWEGADLPELRPKVYAGGGTKLAVAEAVRSSSS